MQLDRVKTVDKQQITAIIEKNVHAKAMRKCDRMGITLAGLIREFLRQWANNDIEISKNLSKI